MTSVVASPWTIDGRAFPTGADLRTQLRFAVRYAILAPSSHNTQPWLFRIGDARVELVCDRTRALPVVDPDDRELLISCGAALFVLRLTLHAHGLAERTTILPDPTDGDLLARVDVIGNASPQTQDVRLFEEIQSRVTSRALFEPDPVPEHVVSAMRSAAMDEGAWLAPFAGADERAAVGSLVARGDIDQFADERFRRELALWMHARRSGDGLAVHGALVTRTLMRTFDIGGRRARSDREIAEGSPLLAVLGTGGDSPRTWIAAGQALAHVLLLAQRAGLASGFLNQPIEVPELRPQLAALTKHEGLPQLLVRFGYPKAGLGAPPRHTARRPLIDVLLKADAP